MELATQFADLKRKKNQLESALKEITSRIEVIQEELIGQMESLGLQNFKLKTGELIIMSEGVYPKVNDQKIFKLWLKRNKMEDILTVHFQTLKSICTTYLEEGKALPAGVEAFMKTRLSIRGLNLSNGGENGNQEITEATSTTSKTR